MALFEASNPRLRTPTGHELLLAQYLAARAKAVGSAVLAAVPDAWFEPTTQRLWLQRNRPAIPPAVTCWALRAGDVIKYTQVMRLPFVTHDMLYVGCGYVVGFARYRQFGEDRITLDRLDDLEVRGKVLVRAWADADTGVLQRHEVVVRALAALGTYTYHPLTFNCQHTHTAIMGLQPHSAAVDRMLGIVLALGLLLVLVLGLVGAQDWRTGRVHSIGCLRGPLT